MGGADSRIEIIDSQATWRADFEALAELVSSATGPITVQVDHIGSTSVPGLPAKDVIDMQAIVASVQDDAIRTAVADGLITAGFSQRPGCWNLRDHVPAGWVGDVTGWDKLVFASPPAMRPGNLHVRAAGSPNERYALLFRDFLRAHPAERDAWGRFKKRLASAVSTPQAYGQVKDPATDILIALAERWARDSRWTLLGP